MPLAQRGPRPGGRYHHLVVIDGVALDIDPVAQSAARRFEEADARAGGGQCVVLIDLLVAGGQIVFKFVQPIDHAVSDNASLDAAKQRGGGPRLGDLSIADLDFDAQVAFDATYRIDDHAFGCAANAGVLFGSCHILSGNAGSGQGEGGLAVVAVIVLRCDQRKGFPVVRISRS